MELTSPSLRPFDLEYGSVDRSIGQTGNAQYGNVFNPIVNQLGFYTGEGFDPTVSEDIETYIKDNDIGSDDAKYLRQFGVGSQENFDNAVRFVKQRSLNRDIIENSSGLGLFITDPAVHASLFLPLGGVRASMYLGRGLDRLAVSQAPKTAKQLTRRARNTFGADLPGVATFAPERLLEVPYIGPKRLPLVQEALGRPVSMAVSAQTLMTGRRYTAAELAKIGALDAAVVDGSLSLIDALNQISYGEDPVEQLQNAAIMTGMTTAAGGLFGYAVGGALGKPSLRINERSRQITQGMKAYLNEVSKTFPRMRKDGVTYETSDMNYAGSWFTDSVFFKAVPTPVRTTISDKFLPDYAKKYMIDLAGDMGMLFKSHQAGIASGTSVFLKSGRRMGDWYQAQAKIDDAFSRVNPTGSVEFLNVRVGAAIEAIRQKLGKNVITPHDWYSHIGRLHIDDVPYDKMTPEEAQAVQAFREFNDKYKAELDGLSLIRRDDAFMDSYMSALGVKGRSLSVMNGIVRNSREWTEKRVAGLEEQAARKIEKRDRLLSQYDERGLTDKQRALLSDLDEEIDRLEIRANKFRALIEKINKAQSLDDLKAMHDELLLTEKQSKALADIGEDLKEQSKLIEDLMEVRAQRIIEGREGPWMHRIIDKKKVAENTDEYRSIVFQAFKRNPYVFTEVEQPNGFTKIVRTKLPDDDVSVSKRVEEHIDRLLNEDEVDNFDDIVSGYGRSGPLSSRTLNLSNKELKDFLVTDVRELMIAYAQRVAPKIEFHRAFNAARFGISDPKYVRTGGTMPLEDMLEHMANRLRKDLVPQESIDKFIKNFVGVYDQIVGRNIRRPDAIDSKVANVLRSATTFTFLGGAGVAALGDTATLFMDHEMRVLGRAFLASLDDPSILPKAKRELNIAGEALELALGTAHLRMLESQSRDIFSRGVTDKINNAFFVANALGPVTIATKVMDGLVRGHTIIEASRKFLDGKASKFEKEFLARYDIDEGMMQKFVDAPYEKTKNGLILANTEAWTDPAAVEAFRVALRAGVANRVIMGTPADKPLVMSGVTYIPENLARKLPFDLPVDPRVPNYRRLESGLLTLPFTFYTYTMGALSKITANHAAGAVRNRLAHVAAAMIIGGMIVKARTPEWAWDNMDIEDKAARAFDFSGLAALYSDGVYRGISMAQELGADMSNFPIQPKFSSDKDPLGALVSLGGAPADWSYEVLQAATDLAQGNFKDGAKGLIRMTPLISTLVTGDAIKDAANDLANFLPNRQ